jgi:hypothetical protein
MGFEATEEGSQMIEEVIGLLGLLALAWFLRSKVFEAGDTE